MVYDIIESVYQHYNDIPAKDNELDLPQTEADLEEFKAEFFPNMDSEIFFDTIEDKIRTIATKIQFDGRTKSRMQRAYESIERKTIAEIAFF